MAEQAVNRSNDTGERGDRSGGESRSRQDTAADQCARDIYPTDRASGTSATDVISQMRDGGTLNGLMQNGGAPGAERALGNPAQASCAVADSKVNFPSIWSSEQLGHSAYSSGSSDRGITQDPPGGTDSRRGADDTKTNEKFQDGRLQEKETSFPGGNDRTKFYDNGQVEFTSRTTPEAGTTFRYNRDGSFAGHSEMRVDPATGVETTRNYNAQDQFTGRSEAKTDEKTGTRTQSNYDAQGKYTGAEVSTPKDATTGEDTTRTYDAEGHKTSEHWQDSKTGVTHDNKWNADGTSYERMQARDGTIKMRSARHFFRKIPIFLSTEA